MHGHMNVKRFNVAMLFAYVLMARRESHTVTASVSNMVGRTYSYDDCL